jgi:protein involved in polysaccharide export with SLBB domain
LQCKVIGMNCRQAADAVRAVQICGLSPVNQTVTITPVRTGETNTDRIRAVRSGDDLIIRLIGWESPNGESIWTVTVKPNGKIELPDVGNLNVAGLYEREVEDAISRGYRNANLMQDARPFVYRTPAMPRTASR